MFYTSESQRIQQMIFESRIHSDLDLYFLDAYAHFESNVFDILFDHGSFPISLISRIIKVFVQQLKSKETLIFTFHPIE